MCNINLDVPLNTLCNCSASGSTMAMSWFDDEPWKPSILRTPYHLKMLHQGEKRGANKLETTLEGRKTVTLRFKKVLEKKTEKLCFKSVWVGVERWDETDKGWEGEPLTWIRKMVTDAQINYSLHFSRPSCQLLFIEAVMCPLRLAPGSRVLPRAAGKKRKK